MKTHVPLERSLYFLHPYNATLVTCKSKDGKTNVMAIAWIMPVNVNPPKVGMSIRPERHSHDVILETKEFVVNIPTFDMAEKVLFCGRTSGKARNKFREVQLTPKKARKVSPPIIKECVAHLECKLKRAIKTGDHTLMIGQVIAAYALKSIFKEVYDMTKFHPCLHVGKNFFTTSRKRAVEPKLTKYVV